MPANFRRIFQTNSARYEGVRPINIYLLRVLFGLMFFVLGKDVWTHIFNHQGAWEPVDAVAWCTWAAFSSLALLGIFYPLKMIPVLLLEIFYKLLWLALVAYPLWAQGQLSGSAAEGITYAFLFVLLPIAIMPWNYVLRYFILNKKPIV